MQYQAFISVNWQNCRTEMVISPSSSLLMLSSWLTLLRVASRDPDHRPIAQMARTFADEKNESIVHESQAIPSCTRLASEL